ncbi:Gfo/Idh/MocA family protein [Salinarimonas sp.]|uniref:Gfo/Idh/MocA family protein n=1 Tax=Salinarimonas sp. TaxID=2766526 RepID=UPI00391A300F
MRRLRVATIGAGYFARFHHEAWARLDDVDLVAICDSDLDKARASAAAHGVPAAFADARAMCDALEIDLLDIATPPASHLALVSLAAERGIAAICQKAFCRDLDEAREATAIAEDAGILLVVHENFRFQPWHREIRAQIAAGAVGHVYQAHFRMRPGDGREPRAYLDRQPYFQKMERFLVHETGIHFVDTFRFLFGEIVAVSARLSRLNPAIAGEDSGLVSFDFANGTRAILDANRLLDHPADNRRLTMGEMLVEGEASTLRLDGYGRLFRRGFGENEEREIAYRWENRGFAGDSVFLLQRHVVDHILTGEPVSNRARDYLANLAVEEAIYRSSARGGETIGLP